jgi:RND family efflux transporter MFP subunit
MSHERSEDERPEAAPVDEIRRAGTASEETDSAGNDRADTARSPRPARGRRLLANLAWLLGGAALAVLLVADPLDLHPLDEWLRGGAGDHQAAAPAAAGGEESARLWTCGMHPQVIEEEPGPCPICGMNMVPLELDPHGHQHEVAAVTGWTCTEHPEVRESGPGECPIDGRPLVPVRPGGAGEREILYYRNPHDPTVVSAVPAKDAMGMDYVPVYAEGAGSGGAVVTISRGMQQSMNVVTASVERRDLAREIRTVGYLDYDQQRMVSVTTKYGGYIEKVHVNYVGEPVRRGQPLFEIYAPELVQTQEELLSALAFARRLEDAPEDARRRAEALAEAARTRLGYWDVGAEQVRRIERTGEAVRTLTVTAPAGGVVMMRLPGLEGMAVKAGMELFHIADLSTLWLSVEVFEDQLSWLETGSEAEVSFSYYPAETFRGRVRIVEPQVAETTRTVGLRLEVPNPDGRLRAGMYATVRFQPVVAEDAVAVPSQALIRTGQRNLVIVALGGGRFAPREVEIGAEAEQWIQVLGGLEPGERVVTSSQFLIDSEANLRAAVQKLIAGREGDGAAASAPPAPAPPAPPDHAGH